MRRADLCVIDREQLQEPLSVGIGRGAEHSFRAGGSHDPSGGAQATGGRAQADF
jgi:hypothetical protein